MHLKLNVYIILLFLLANIVIFSIVFFLAIDTSKNLTKETNEYVRSAVLPAIKDDVERLGVASKAFIIYDPDTRVVIAGKNENLRFAPASSAKIMTAGIVLEEYPLQQIIKAEGTYNILGSKMKLEEGELITVENLLYGMMLPSGNDAAVILAKNYPGGMQKFIEKMNTQAAMLNLKNTYFEDPAGLSDSNYTTAFDMARMASHYMKNEKFKEIVKTEEKVVTDISGRIVHDLRNLNELLGSNGVNGVKTGFTEEAGGVLVTSVSKENKRYIIVIMNSPDRFADTRTIIFNIVKNINLINY